ncbi:MAG: thiamine diphosphokinase [Lachnospiraceae bacterium]|nr:thiamine diphosphokinase [Lachnospiraceae bacterium]
MNASKICYIAGGGPDYGLPFTPRPGDLVIAADAGLRTLTKHGITADYIIGDFDSLEYIPQAPNVTALSPEKDVTDMSAAISIGMEKGYDLFYLYGGTGGRIDHTIANLQILADLAARGKQGFLFGDDIVITAIRDGKLCFDAVSSGYVSVFSHSERAVGVYLKGLKYELENAVLENTYPLGVSNEFAGKKSSIAVESGTLVVVLPDEALGKLCQ